MAWKSCAARYAFCGEVSVVCDVLVCCVIWRASAAKEARVICRDGIFSWMTCLRCLPACMCMLRLPTIRQCHKCIDVCADVLACGHQVPLRGVQPDFSFCSLQCVLVSSPASAWCLSPEERIWAVQRKRAADEAAVARDPACTCAWRAAPVSPRFLRLLPCVKLR